MKTNFFKNTLPFAAVAILGISGAFFTTSMQNASSKAAPENGYITVESPCDTPKQCNTSDNYICTANGQQAFGLENNCSKVLYQPEP